MKDKDKDCVFCKIIAGELPAKMVYEDDDFVVFDDIHPQTPVHMLVVPRKHIERVMSIESSDIEKMGRVFEIVAKVAKKTGIEDAFWLRVNNGADAGQVVDHLHFHVMGGFSKKEK